MVTFTVLVPEGTLGSSVGAVVDILTMARQVAQSLDRPPPDFRVLGTGALARLSNGMAIETTPLDKAVIQPDSILVVPGIGLDLMTANEALGRQDVVGLEHRYADTTLRARLARADMEQFAVHVRRHHQRNGFIGAACSGVLLLAQSGVLDGCKATTHWRLARFFSQTFPEIELDTHRLVVSGQRLVTAGAALAQADLMLFLLRRFLGCDIANRTKSYMLVDDAPIQARYMVWDEKGGMEGETLSRFETLIETALPAPPSIAEAARTLNLTERTLARHLIKATGSSPKTVVGAIRMRHARRLLDTTDLPLDEIAARVGYANATSLRKLTLRMTNGTPAMVRGNRQPPPVAPT